MSRLSSTRSLIRRILSLSLHPTRNERAGVRGTQSDAVGLGVLELGMARRSSFWIGRNCVSLGTLLTPESPLLRRQQATPSSCCWIAAMVHRRGGFYGRNGSGGEVEMQRWKKAKEEISSSYSGLHFGHYKAGTASRYVSHFHALKATLIMHHGLVLERWLQGLSVMLQKLYGCSCSILLMEADFNGANCWKVSARPSARLPLKSNLSVVPTARPKAFGRA